MAFNIGRRISQFLQPRFYNGSQERFMKPENKIPYSRLSDGNDSHHDFQQRAFTAADGDIEPSVSIIFLSAVSGMPTRRP